MSDSLGSCSESDIAYWGMPIQQSHRKWNKLRQGAWPLYQHPMIIECGMSLGKQVKPWARQSPLAKGDSLGEIPLSSELSTGGTPWNWGPQSWKEGRDAHHVLWFPPTTKDDQRKCWWNKIATFCPSPQKCILAYSVLSPRLYNNYSKGYFQFGAFLH